jgi:putative flippase GtrA
MIGGRTFGELVRYGVTGALCVGLNVVIVTLLTEYVHLYYLLSFAVCFVTVTLVGFALNRWWTFRKFGGAPAQDLRRYVIVTVANMAIGIPLCGLLVDVVGLHYWLAIVLISLAFVPVTFLLQRSWSFKLGRGH